MDRDWPQDGSDNPYSYRMNDFYQEFLGAMQQQQQQLQPAPYQQPPSQQCLPPSAAPHYFDTPLQDMSQQMLSPQLINSPEQMLSSQNTQSMMMRPEQMMISQEMMPRQPMIPAHQQLSSQQLISTQQIISQEQMLSPEQLMTSQQLLPSQQIMSPPQLMSPSQMPQNILPQLMLPPAYPVPDYGSTALPRGDNPRELRNKAEKQRRDRLNHSISELASIVPPVLASNRKIDKTGVLRLTAHYLRAYQYVFGDSIGSSGQEFTPGSAQALLSLLNGFLLTTTYKGLVVVVSQNIQQYLGYAELDLLGHSIFNYVHPEDVQFMKQNLMPKSHLLGPSGELLLPEELDGRRRIEAKLANDRRRFMVRFRKHGPRSEPTKYVSCYVEGTLRKSDRACRTPSRSGHVVRRARARAENPYSSGNDVVFVGIVRPTVETFVSEQHLEAFRMEYRTRHSMDGEIMECEQRISLVAGYMTHEVNGINAMHFMHRDDVHWVIFTLREMYEQHQLVGESCYRLMAKNGQFLYMRTRGVLDVDEHSKAVRSMVCTNTVVDEKEGKQLIKLMKQKCLMMIKSHRSLARNVKIDQIILDDDEDPDQEEDKTLPLNDLKKVIQQLLTDLPAEALAGLSPGSLKEIPQKRDLIANENIYKIIGTGIDMNDTSRSPSRSLIRLAEKNRREAENKRAVEGLGVFGTSPQPLRNVFRHISSYPSSPQKTRTFLQDNHQEKMTESKNNEMLKIQAEKPGPSTSAAVTPENANIYIKGSSSEKKHYCFFNDTIPTEQEREANVADEEQLADIAELFEEELIETEGLGTAGVEACSAQAIGSRTEAVDPASVEFNSNIPKIGLVPPTDDEVNMPGNDFLPNDFDNDFDRETLI